MPTWLEIALLAILALIIALAIGGAIAERRRRASRHAEFEQQLEEANRALAAARADDRGWDPVAMETAAREAHGRRGSGPVGEMYLIQVIDKPGTEDDQARFRVVDEHGEHDVLVGRRGGDWVELQS